MSEISPRPWKVNLKNGTILDANDGIVIANYDYDVDAEHIVKCVNEYDSLVVEVARLKEAIKYLLSHWDCTTDDDVVPEWIVSLINEKDGEG